MGSPAAATASAHVIPAATVTGWREPVVVVGETAVDTMYSRMY
jgi:hypothetical protein